MPGWSIHKRIYEITDLDENICVKIDKILDDSPPKAKEVLPFVKEDTILPIHFGFRKTDFPYMYSYIAKRYGIEGAKCFLAHIVLDLIENSLRKGYDKEMIVDQLNETIIEYHKVCSKEEHCPYYDEVFRDLQKELINRADSIIKIIREWLDQKILPIEKLLKASEAILSFILRAKLYVKGYQGKQGFSVRMDVYRETYGRAKILLKQHVFKAALSGEIKDIDRIIESINNIKKEGRKGLSALKYLDLIINERKKNEEFDKYFAIINLVVDRVVEEYRENTS